MDASNVKSTFRQACADVQEQGLLQDTIHTGVEEQVAMFLHVVGHNQRLGVMHNMLRRSMETISKYFKQVMYVVEELIGEMIVSPVG